MRIGADQGDSSLSPKSLEKTQNVKSSQAAGTSLVGINLVPPAAAPNPITDAYRSPRTLATFVNQLIAEPQDAPNMHFRHRIDPAAGAKISKDMSDIAGVPKRYKMRPF